MKTKSAPSREVLKRQSEVFKALGHPGRMAILHALSDEAVCACELAEVAGCSAPTASRHLSILRHAGLIEDERRGQQVFYHLTCPCVLSFAECIERVDAGEDTSGVRIGCSG